MKQILNTAQWQTRVSDLYVMARLSRQSHAAFLLCRQANILDELDRKHGSRRVYSQYMAGYVQGLLDAGNAALYRYQLEFCYVGTDGVIYSTHKNSAHRSTNEFYDTDRGSQLGNLPCAHFWKGSDKPFGVIEPISAVQSRVKARISAEEGNAHYRSMK